MNKWVYLDTSAVVKLFVAEEHSNALTEWISAHRSDHFTTSDLTRTELRRTLHASRADTLIWEQAEPWINLYARIRLTPDLCDQAGVICVNTGLRSLDALHTASALTIGSSLNAFITYDKRLASVASSQKIPVVIPQD